MTSSLVGRKLGVYQITDLLGQGGMATVYKGYREDIDRTVAIKVLPPHPGQNQEFIERFKLEARTIARLQHPHILPLYDYGVEDDILYLVMAYVEGGSLSGLIDKGHLSPLKIEKSLRQMSAALDYAHRQGVIHRDIKPDNILLDKEGNALLADFGIVKLVEGSGAHLTVTGGLVGTPAYMAPEQGIGADITASVDIYSLGVVVYEMLTGKQPYSADTPMQMVIKHINEPVPSLRNIEENVPASLDAVMQQVLAKEPQNRYQTAVDFADDFSAAIHSEESWSGLSNDVQSTPKKPTLKMSPQPTSAPTPTERMIQPTAFNNPLVLLGGFAIIALLIVVVVALLLNNNRGNPEVSALPTLLPTSVTPQADAGATAVPQTTFGRLSFSTTNKLGDTVTLQARNLTPPGEGEVYVAWLENTVDGSVIKLGELRPNASGDGMMTLYIDDNGRLLPAFFNAVRLTREQPNTEKPGHKVLYSAKIAPEVAQVMKVIFITSPDGIAVSRLQRLEPNTAAGEPTAGLLDSALGEADKAHQHADLVQLAANNEKNVTSMHTHNEHTINIVLGTNDDLDGDGTGQNAGFGVGVVYLLDLMGAQLDRAINAPDSMPEVQSSLEIMRVCLDNSRQRIDQLVALEKQLLVTNAITDEVLQTANDSAAIAAQLLNGFDDNGNGEVESQKNECGLQQLQTLGLRVSSMNLVEGALTES